MAFRKVGSWEKVKGLIGNIGNEMMQARNTSLKRWGLKAESIAVGHISRQDLRWVPLRPSTIAEKVRKGYSENILVRTSDYFKAITSWVDGDTVYAGVKASVVNKDGEEIADYAAVHEFGSRSGRIPARPLWRPTYGETMRWHISNNMPVNIFNKQMKKYGI